MFKTKYIIWIEDMKVLHVITSLSRHGGGPSRSAQGLVAGLNRAGVETWLMTLYHGDQPWIDGVAHFVNGEQFEDVALRVKPQVVHLHGLWNIELHRCAVICRRRHIPYVIAPRGMLEPWSLKQKWLKKRIARWLYQDRDLKKAAALHATAESEAEQFRKLGFMNPVIVSPNGVNFPKKDKNSTLQLQLKAPTLYSPVLSTMRRSGRPTPTRISSCCRPIPRTSVLSSPKRFGRVFR